MKIRVFTPHYNAGNRAVLEAFAQGLPGALLHDDRAYMACDVMVIFGLWKKSFAKSAAKRDLLRAHRGPVIVIERGYVQRDEYWSAGLGGINGLADFKNTAMPTDRWKKLGIEFEPWKDRAGPVIVCGQVPWDVSVQDEPGGHAEWCRRTVLAVKKRGFEVVFRPHPYAVEKKVDYGVDCDISRETLAADLARAQAVVTHCSNIGVDAAIAGVPVIAMNRMSMAWEVAGRGTDDLFRPARPDRSQWGANLAYAQWTLEEFRAGDAARHLGF